MELLFFLLHRQFSFSVWRLTLIDFSFSSTFLFPHLFIFPFLYLSSAFLIRSAAFFVFVCWISLFYSFLLLQFLCLWLSLPLIVSFFLLPFFPLLLLFPLCFSSINVAVERTRGPLLCSVLKISVWVKYYWERSLTQRREFIFFFGHQMWLEAGISPVNHSPRQSIHPLYAILFSCPVNPIYPSIMHFIAPAIEFFFPVTILFQSHAWFRWTLWSLYVF